MTRARRGRAGGGFTTVEVMIALAVLAVVAASLGRVASQVTHVVRRSRLELGAAHFLMAEAVRLRETPFAALSSGSRTQADSVATWTVSDSGGVRLVFLVTGYNSRTTGKLVALDSALIVRRSLP